MTFGIEKISKNDSLTIIKSTMDGLLNAKEAVDENLHWQKEGLKELTESPEEHHEAILVQKDDIEQIEKSIRNVEEKIDRMNAISSQSEHLFFLISTLSSLDELKELLSIIKEQLESEQNPSYVRFLETLQETAETCKEFRSQGQIFKNQYIPLLESENKYSVQLLSALTRNNSDDFKIIEEIYNQAVNSSARLGFSGNESVFLKRLQKNIEEIVNKQSSESISREECCQQIQDKIAKQISELNSIQSYSYEFKKLINDFCDKLKLPAPFAVTQTKENIINKFKQMKTNFSDMKKRRGSSANPELDALNSGNQDPK